MPAADPPHVALRAWTDGDLPLLRGLLGDPAMMTYLGGPESEEKLLARHQRYLDVPAAAHRLLLNAASIGDFVNTVIKPRFEVQQV